MFLPSLNELESLPTLCQGQAENLKIEDADEMGRYRVWLSRCTVEDGEPFDNAATIERELNGRWETVERYQAK